jgi:hypothetical protein
MRAPGYASTVVARPKALLFDKNLHTLQNLANINELPAT